MKSYSSKRLVVNVALLLSALTLLSACDWLKKKGSCPGCETSETYGTSSAAPGETLLSLRNKPVITVGSFEEYWQDLLKSDPNAEAMLPFVPDARTKVFEHAVTEKLVQEWIHASGKDKDAEYQRKLKKQVDLACRMVALQAFQEDVMKNIDTSDAGLEKFYDETKDKNSMFQHPPFLVAPKGIKLQSATFTNEKQAKEALAKAQSGIDFTTATRVNGKALSKDLGIVTARSENVPAEVKAKARDMKSGDVALVHSGKQFIVLKAGNEQEGKYAPFADVKDSVKQAKLQIEFAEKFAQRLEELKKEFGATENKDFFVKEQEKRQADMQAKMKEFQEQQAQGQPEAGAQAPGEVVTTA